MKHLDLGCGTKPKNPYNCDELYGVDLSEEVLQLGQNFKVVNLVTEKLPFPDNFFDSVSAFDVFEHIPRLVIDFSSKKQYLSFMNLLDEIHRVLKPGGRLYAVIPMFPSADAFTDPTHVNIMTEKTHEYFCGKERAARQYGFKGTFELLEARWINNSVAKRAHRSFKLDLRIWFRTFIKRNQTHFVWQLKAIKK